MRRTTSLTAALLLGLAVLGPAPTTAAAAGETCRGLSATIVGTPGDDVVGTDGADVVVTNGSTDVDTRGGDDVVCVTGSSVNRGWTYVDSGAGDDVVDGTGTDRRVSATLGTGADRFEGGAGDDSVEAGPGWSSDPAVVDDAADVVLGGAGDDDLNGAQDGLAASDLIDGGLGDDVVSAFTVPSAGATLTGGPGRDRLDVGTEDHVLSWDMSDDALRVDDGWTVPVSGFEDTFLAAPSIQVSGTDEDNELWFVTCDLTVRGRGGDDSMWLGSDLVWEEYQSCGGDTVMVGGGGNDRFSTYGQGDDRLVGGGGDDTFTAKGGEDTVLGGAGRDRAMTGRDADRFVGGPGRDHVDGEQGRDLCDGEREVRCER